MQEIIDRILEGNFEYENGSLDFSCAKVEISIPAGAIFEGTFRIRSTPGCLTDGYINTTDIRMECLTPTFTGSDEEIAFCFHGENMEEGDVVKGAFNVISNRGEYYLPFVVSVEHTILDSSIGTIKNLFHFANLAKSNWQEAVNLFYSPRFACIFTESDSKIYDCYRGLAAYPGNEQNVEEFLIQINKKEKVEFLTEEQEISLELTFCENPDNPNNILEQEIKIVRNGWGYTALNIECDGEFLFTEKERLTSDDFQENKCSLPVFIDGSRCKKGNHFGQIVLFNSYVCLTIPVTVKVEQSKQEKEKHSKRHMVMQIMKFYQEFKLKKMNSATWIKETTKLVDKLVAMNENDVPIRLFQAQLLISDERYNEAKWLLEHAMSIMEQKGIDDSTLLAYCLYLTTLIYKSEKYVKRVTDEVRQIYKEDRSRWRVAWLLLYLEEKYEKSLTNKWAFLEKQFYYGCRSPILYVEALALMGNNPTLLCKLGKFEIQVLYYGVKQQMIGPELREQILSLTGKVREYSPVLFKILVSLYTKKADMRIVQEICTQLIKGNRTERKYFDWYKRGVEAQLRITNLCEYYMVTLDLSMPQKLPQMLLQYFAYQNNLDYEHSAYLYHYVLQHKSEMFELYETYRVRMERFVQEQIQKRHINRNLAALYQAMLTQGMITEELAKALTGLIFANQIQVEDCRLQKVIIYQSGNLKPKEYLLQDCKTWISLYGNDYTILFEDRWGNRFGNSVEYTLEKLMVPGKFLRMIAQYDKDCPELDRYLCETNHNEVKTESIERVLRVAASDDVAPEIKREIYLRILQYYYDMDDMNALDRHLEMIPFEELNMEERSEVLRFMVLRGKYQMAYQWIVKFGPYFVDAKTLMRLTSEMMQRNNLAEDVTLTAAAVYAFQKGKYDSTILSYLILYYGGMTKDMRDIWKAARSFEVDCYKLSERILVQMLYSGAFVGEMMDIFRYYVSQGGRQELQEAFLVQCAYDYFVKEKLTDRYVFQEIRYAYQRGEEVRLVCKLAYLKYFAEEPKEILEKDKPLIEIFLNEMLKKGIYLKFFRNLKDFQYLTWQMKDKTIVEYRAHPGGKVRIHYVIMNENGEADGYLSQYMTEVYAGVCFKEFVLFFGESLQYYITEEYDGEEQLTESGNIQKSEAVSEACGNRYAMINDMVISKALQDYDALDKMLEEFCRKEYWNNQIFQLQ